MSLFLPFLFYLFRLLIGWRNERARKWQHYITSPEACIRAITPQDLARGALEYKRRKRDDKIDLTSFSLNGQMPGCSIAAMAHIYFYERCGITYVEANPISIFLDNAFIASVGDFIVHIFTSLPKNLFCLASCGCYGEWVLDVTFPWLDAFSLRGKGRVPPVTT